MKKTLNITLDPALMMTVAGNLKNAELGRLFRALAAHMAGGDAGQYLNNSALRLTFALLSPAIDESLERLALNRANGAKGGRPRKQPAMETPATSLPVPPSSLSIADGGQRPVSAKKSKKEDHSPTPPKEEKIKKNNLPVVDDNALSHEEIKHQILNNELMREQACMALHIQPGEYQALACEIFNGWEFTREQDWSYKHLLNTMRIKVRENKQPQKRQNHANHQKFIADPVARREAERESRRQEVCRAIAELAAESQQPVEPPF